MTRRLIFVALLVMAGCRGMTSEAPPIHPNLNMDFQENFKPQEANVFFEDAAQMPGAAMRPPVPGTVARGLLKADAAFYLGRTEGGAYTAQMPVPMTQALLERGQQRYNIYCAVCHGRAGDGQGIIMTGGYGYTPAPTFHDARLRGETDGYIYDVITNGVRNMPAYGPQVAVADRWAIVAYIRALQLSQNAQAGDLTPADLAEISQAGGNIEGGRTGGGTTPAGTAPAASTPAQTDTTTPAPTDTTTQR